MGIPSERKLSVHYLDGLEILSFKALRSLGILGLLLLQSTQLMSKTDIEWASMSSYELIVYVWTSFFLLYFDRNTNFLQIGIFVYDLYTLDRLGSLLEGHNIVAFDSHTAGGVRCLFNS